MFAFSSFGSVLEVRCWMFNVRVFFRQRCGSWVDVTVDSLAGALEEALALSDDELAAMGQRCLPPDRFR